MGNALISDGISGTVAPEVFRAVHTELIYSVSYPELFLKALCLVVIAAATVRCFRLGTQWFSTALLCSGLFILTFKDVIVWLLLGLGICRGSESWFRYMTVIGLTGGWLFIFLFCVWQLKKPSALGGEDGREKTG